MKINYYRIFDNMENEWIKGVEGKNLKFKRETLLNYAANRWALNKAASVDAVMSLIRKCAPKTFEDWENYYFEHAKQKKKTGIKIDRGYIADLGRRLFTDLSKDVRSELDSIKEDECIDYMYNLVLNRTFEGYESEIQIINDELQQMLGIEIKPASDEWDRIYNVDYYIEVRGKYIGLQIKPIESGVSLNDYQWYEMHEKAHKEFKEKFGGAVFFVFSVKSDLKKIVYNKEVIDEIKAEIERLGE